MWANQLCKVAAVKIPADYFPDIGTEEAVAPDELFVIKLLKVLKVVFNALVT